MELDKEIADADRYRGVKYQLAEDCLQSALLARGLERPRAEVEQRLARAERIADEVGHTQQRLCVAYNTAWSAAWWFDDLDQMSRTYEIVEQLAIQSNQANDLELLTNLYMVLTSAVVSGRLDKQATKLETREAQLMEALGRIAADTDRPNNALQARTSLYLWNSNMP